MRHVRSLALGIALFTIHVGCADPRSNAVTSFENCVMGGADSIRPGETKKIECTAQEPFWLVALPGRHIDSSELAAIGISKDVAETLRGDDKGRSLLCFVEEFERPDPVPDNFTTAKSSCLTTLLSVAQVGQSKSNRQSVSVSVNADGQITIESLEAR